MILDYIKKYWVKSTLIAFSLVFFGWLGIDMLFFNDIIDPIVNYYLRAAAIAISISILVLFSGKAFEALFNGALTSPKGIIVGIWMTYFGILWHNLFEELPEAIIIRLEKGYNLHNHDHPLHWVHHVLRDMSSNEMSLIGAFITILGGFLILISSQMLNKSKVIMISSWIVFAMVIFGIAYRHTILPFFGL